MYPSLFDAINGMKKRDLVDHTGNLKGEISDWKRYQGLFKQISKLSENVYRLVAANGKLNSDV